MPLPENLATPFQRGVSNPRANPALPQLVLSDVAYTRTIQHYLGHKNIQHTTRYTELAADRFKGFWKE